MNREEKVFWKNSSLVGEGLWRKSSGEDGVVICHPHPLMGGSMHNNVVEAVRDAFSSCGYSTLRFNFRGVGESTGHYDEGEGEKQDILSACEFIKNQGVKKITLAGYSFGAWVCCRLLKDQMNFVSDVIFISPPQKYFNFEWSGAENTVKWMICGYDDQFCDVQVLEKIAESIHSKICILPDTDHFYAGREALLAEKLKSYIDEKKA